ncbi:hypothetical protein BGX21_006860 [Mortierella sp. AD011]|nr:hypothetical protein BGX20_003282 [Mortierella sp. AD010]KAF9399069.1 hypothetical protein BGX21_006860 [Mortierella sp. AD011]
MNPSSSPYGYLPYTPNSQVTSPGVQTQQPLSPQQHQQQLGNVAQDLNQDLSTPSTPLSLNPSTSVPGSSTSPVGVRSSVPTLSSHGHPTINTTMLSNSFGGMLPSPQQSSQVPSTPTGTSALPTTPPQTADLDTILATYSNQPELLKLIIASKTEEDRRWAEEARFKMMDLIMRGEGRGVSLITGYESLLSQVVPVTGTATTTTTTASAVGTPVSSVSSGNISTSTSPSTSTSAATPITIPSSTIITGSLALTPGKRFMDDEFDAYSGTGGNVENSSGGVGSFSQGPDHGLSRKRSVTFARDVGQGHLRSQSMSSVPTLSSSLSSAATSADTFGTLSMLGIPGPNPALQQHHQQPLHQVQHPSMHQLPPLSLQQQYPQQPHSQFQQQHQQASHQATHQLPPQFGQYPQVFQYHVMPQLNQQQGVIRRTNSLSHLSHLAHSQHTTVTEPRLVAGRPRNDSATSMRTQEDDSDEESDEEYADNHVLAGLNSRPGSSLSMNNMMGGNGETSLTLDFSDMASVSGPTVYTQQQQQQQSQHSHQQGQVQSQGQNQGQHNSSASPTSIMSSLHGQGALVSMGMSGMGASTGMRGIPANTTGSAAAAAAAAAADPKRKRKRREMQPVNKIVESNEPIVDQYLWKNNGNTTQKKTGCKSVYYKCSNSPGGCTVNKTVTEKEGGGYITKYRGEHLDDCIKFKRAQLAAQAQAAHHAYSLREQ